MSSYHLGFLMWMISALVARGQAYRTPVRASWAEDPASSVGITWDTPVAARGTVMFGLTTNYTQTLHDGGGLHKHVITLHGLRPGTRYYYQASSTDGYVSQPASFMTAPAAGQPLHFVAHGDLNGALSIRYAQAVSDAIRAEDPQWVIQLGDMADEGWTTNQGFDTWADFYNICSNELARCVLMPCMGNHDSPDQTPLHERALFYRLFTMPEPWPGRGYYAYTAGNARFITLNSEVREPAEQNAWLACELQAAAYDTNITWIMASFHRPPYSWGQREGWDAGRTNWCPLLTQYEADWVMGGHSHNYQRTVPINGVRYLAAGGGGGVLYYSANNQPELEYATSCYHYASFHVTGDVMQARGIRSDGLVFDSITITNRRFVRVEPAFPQRGRMARIVYRADAGPLRDARPVYTRIGTDAFTNAFADAAMTFNAGTGMWEYDFMVPSAATGRVVFAFHDQGGTNRHDNHGYNWQALLERVTLDPVVPKAGSKVKITYMSDMGPLSGSRFMFASVRLNQEENVPPAQLAMIQSARARWECFVTLPPHAESMTVDFFNGTSWDDNHARRWTFPVADTVARSWPSVPYVAQGSPFVSCTPEDGAMNRIGDNFDFNMESPSIRANDTTLGEGDFGEIYCNLDAVQLYVGGIGASLGASNNVLLLFLGLDTLDDAAWDLSHKTGLPNALDYLHNVRFPEPMNLAIVLGDQYGDNAAAASFPYPVPGGYDFGQGVYYIGRSSPAFSPVKGAKLSQFEGTGTAPCTRTQADQRATMRWEVSIPWGALGATGPACISNLFMAGIVGSSATSGNNRYLSRAYIGEQAWGARDADGQYAFNTVTIRPLRINLAHADLRGDGIPNEWRMQFFGTPDGPAADEDSDGDGADNLNEFVSGTDPGDPASVFSTACMPGGPGSGSLTLRWTWSPGRLYDVLHATNPAVSFAPLAEGVTSGVYTVAVERAPPPSYFKIKATKP